MRAAKGAQDSERERAAGRPVGIEIGHNEKSLTLFKRSLQQADCRIDALELCGGDKLGECQFELCECRQRSLAIYSAHQRRQRFGKN